MTGSINRQSATTGKNPLVGGVRLNLPEFARLVSCAIVTDHHSLQCSKAMSFGYLYTVGSGELIIGLEEQKKL